MKLFYILRINKIEKGFILKWFIIIAAVIMLCLLLMPTSWLVGSSNDEDVNTPTQTQKD